MTTVAAWMAVARTVMAGGYIQRDGLCYNFSGWPGEEVRCERIAGHKEHEGACEYPSSSPQTRINEMENVTIGKLIEAFDAHLKATELFMENMKKLIALPVTEEPKGRKGKRAAEDPKPAEPAAPPAVKEEKPKQAELAIAPAASGEPVPHAQGGALTVGDVTIELIRKASTEYSKEENFGMTAWLALCEKVTGVKKVSAIKPEFYGLFYGTMTAELDAKAKGLPVATSPGPVKTEDPKPVAAPAAEITLDMIKPKAKAYMDANGDKALASVLAAFGAKKLSEIEKGKYPAFMEAITNA